MILSLLELLEIEKKESIPTPQQSASNSRMSSSRVAAAGCMIDEKIQEIQKISRMFLNFRVFFEIPGRFLKFPEISRNL